MGAAAPRPATLVALVCTAQVLAQIGAYTWPALLPGIVSEWGISNSEAGAVTGAFYAAYVAAVPVLVTLTDRIDPRRIYLLGVALTVAGHLGFALFADGFVSALLTRTVTGIGWAGTYMTGLKLLADRVDERLMSRAVAGHAASIGVSGALSFGFAGVLADGLGWQGAFAAAALSAAIAFAIVALAVPGRAPARSASPAPAATFDFLPVLRNRPAMAYSVAYCVHTWEMSALRGWVVAFLGYVAGVAGSDAQGWPSPIAVATLLALVGTGASVFGNELSIRYGRARLVGVAMIGSAVLAIALGLAGPLAYSAAVLLTIAWACLIWLDSSSLTAGAAGSAAPGRRGATLAIHSMLGYAGGFLGPFVIGAILDLAGGMSSFAWALAFGHAAVASLLGYWLHRRLGPAALAGDRVGDRVGRP